MATPAKTCRKALDDATLRWPKRNRKSDGIMGDNAHENRKSDHNLGNAFDLTHDPDNGVDCYKLALEVIKDPRVTYVIWNSKIHNRTRAAEGWRPYTGANKHTHHMHVSIKDTARDDLSPWPWSGAADDAAGGNGTAEAKPNSTSAPPYPGAALREGSSGPSVRLAQQRLKELGHQLSPDGIFGGQTRTAVIAFQRAKGLASDGIVGAQTWAALWAG